MEALTYDTNLIGPTFTGRVIDVANPRTEDIDIEDIAHSLSMQCRYNGHTKFFYSVAEHSNLVADQLVKILPGCSSTGILYALMHDASEAYLGDMVAPMRGRAGMAVYNQWHAEWQAAVEMKYQLIVDVKTRGLVKTIDLRIRADEHVRLLPDHFEYKPGVEPLNVRFACMGPAEAKMEFLSLFALHTHVSTGVKRVAAYVS